MRTLPNLVKDRAGTSALEFAIIAPLFFLILFTLIAYGIYLSVTHAVQQVAADAALTAVAGLNQNERITLVNHYLDASHFDYAFLDRARMQVAVTDDPSLISGMPDALEPFVLALVPAASAAIAGWAAPHTPRSDA